jgi:hypothetical protein
MIIANGHIEFKLTDSTPRMINGYPTASEESWSDPIPCQINLSRTSTRERDNGEANTLIVVELIVEFQPLPESEQLRLTDLTGRELGEYVINAIPEPLEAVDQIIIKATRQEHGRKRTHNADCRDTRRD